MPRQLKPPSELSPAYRKRIESYMRRHPFATRTEARGHKLKEMFRTTLGTGISDQRKRSWSFTLYAYSQEKIDVSDYSKLEDFFQKKLVEFLRILYPKKDYTWTDWWGRVIIREEMNLKMDYNREDFQKYSYEISQVEQEKGELADIL